MSTSSASWMSRAPSCRTLTAARMTSADQVAQVIYAAATDGTDRLRYLVGDGSRGFIRARQDLSDQEYVEFMRSRFQAMT
jgi:hypothetical protein